MRILTIAVLLVYCIISNLYIYSVEETLEHTKESLRITDKMNGKIYSKLSDLEIQIAE